MFLAVRVNKVLWALIFYLLIILEKLIQILHVLKIGASIWRINSTIYQGSWRNKW